MTSPHPVSAPPPAPKTLSARERYTPVLISVISTGIVLGLLVWIIGSSEQWPLVQKQFFSLDKMRASFPDVLNGFWLNMKIWVYAEILILIVSLVLAMMRSFTGPIAAPFRFAAVVYIDTLRGIPALLLDPAARVRRSRPPASRSAQRRRVLGHRGPGGRLLPRTPPRSTAPASRPSTTASGRRPRLWV